MKISLIVVSIVALCIPSTLAQPAAPESAAHTELESQEINPVSPMVSDMVQDGWPIDQAQVIVSLFDAVDALPDLPERNEEDSDEERFFDNLRVDVSQLLAQAGYAYKSIGSRQRVIMRLADGQDTNPPQSPSPQQNRRAMLIHTLHQLASLVGSANKFISLLDNATLTQYGSLLLEAAQSIDKLVAFPDAPK